MLRCTGVLQPTAALGHSRPGRASSESGYGGYAPKADVSFRAFSGCPLRDLADYAPRSHSALPIMFGLSVNCWSAHLQTKIVGQQSGLEKRQSV